MSDLLNNLQIVSLALLTALACMAIIWSISWLCWCWQYRRIHIRVWLHNKRLRLIRKFKGEAG